MHGAWQIEGGPSWIEKSVSLAIYSECFTSLSFRGLSVSELSSGIMLVIIFMLDFILFFVGENKARLH